VLREERKEQRAKEKDSRQWVEGRKQQTTDYGTTDNQKKEGRKQGEKHEQGPVIQGRFKC